MTHPDPAIGNRSMMITINGNAYEARETQTILDVARDNGIYIPSLCQHPEIGALSTCRACAVEVKGMPGLQPACSTLVSDGMVIMTKSRKAIEAQTKVIELLLSRGIHNCADCTRYGNCQLQDAAFYLGIELDMTGPVIESSLVSWFYAPYWNEGHALWPGGAKDAHLQIIRDIDDSDPLMRLDRDKCVLCGLCVEACHLAGRDVIQISHRGYRSRIIFDNDVRLHDSNCDHCGRCLKVCPVGALINLNAGKEL